MLVVKNFTLISLLTILGFRLVAQAPSNDNPCAAIALSIAQNCNNALTFSNLGATTTTENGYIINACSPSSLAPSDVWFKTQTTSNGSPTDTKLTIKTNGAAIGQIRVFSALTCNGPFSEINQVCHPTSNNLQLTAENLSPGSTIYIQVAGYWDNTPQDNFTICVTPPPIVGCTNPLASNYNSNAVIDNGTCVFNTAPATTCDLFTSNPNVFVSNNQIVADVINIQLGNNRVITDLDVMIKLNHTFISDLYVTLTSPSGTTIDLFKNICGSSDNLEVRFDDNSYPLLCGNPTRGYYKLPLGLLSTFNNEPINGDWTLKVIDGTFSDNGVLNQWCLIPQTKAVNCYVPIACRATSVTPNSATLSWTSVNSPSESSWNIEYGTKGFNPTGVPTAANISSIPFTISNLSPKKEYEFYVQSNCGVGIKSGWAGPFPFTTAIANGECNMNLNIPDQSCNLANNYIFNVNNANGTKLGTDIRLKEVRMIVRHSWLSDLTFNLTSPSGKIVELSYKNGNQDNNYGDPDAPNCSQYTAFVQNYDCGGISINNGKAPFIGKFYPEGNLVTFHDNTNPNGNWIFKVCDLAGGDIGKLEYFELIFSNNNCLSPKNLAISDITDHVMKLNWQAGNASCQETIIEYGPRGFTPGDAATAGSGGTVITLPCPNSTNYTLSNLIAKTEYDIYLREKCDANNFSENSCVYSTQTNCNQTPISLSEKFDTQNDCSTSCGSQCQINGIWNNTLTDDFDWIINSGSTPSPGTGPSDDITGGGKYAYIEAGTNGTCQFGKVAYLLSDCIKINQNADECAMSFFYHQYGTEIGKITLEISVEGAFWQKIWEQNGNKGERWIKQYIDLQAFRDKVVQFRIGGFGGNGTKADLAIDQIEFYGATVMGSQSALYYKDADGDGFGDLKFPLAVCSTLLPTGYVTNANDCNDKNPNINPSKTEIPCNKIDENCNGNEDDKILPSPIISNAFVCEGQSLKIAPNSKAEGQLYWYDSATSPTPISIGDTLIINNLTSNKTVFVKDSVVKYPGVRISELNLGVSDAIEIQNVGAARDFTGWRVALGVSNSSDIFPVNALWNLGVMSANEVQFRTKSPANNFFGATFDWNSGKKGWAMIIDNQGVIADFVIWNTDFSDLDNFSATINGKTYTRQDLPWSGIGLIPICPNGTTINLIAQGEKDNQSDYNPCATNSMGSANNNFDVTYPCASLLAQATIQVVAYPQLQITTLPEVCENEIFDIRNIAFNDIKNTVGQISFHENSPATAANQISNFNLSLSQNTNIVVKKTTATAACSNEKTVTIKVNSLPTANINTSSSSVCSNQTKILNASYNGGTGAVNYYWSTGATSNTISAGATFPNTKGFYAVTVTDIKGCQDSASIDIAKGAGITTAKIISVQNTTNCSSEDGKITLQPLDGTPPYNFQWKGAQSGAVGSVQGIFSIENLKKGTYAITITDSSPLNCNLVIPFVAINSPEISVKIDSVWSVSCKGKNDGKVILKNTGSANVSYNWSNNTTQKDLQNVAPGAYSVTITNGICPQILSNILVKEPDALGILSAIVSDESCTANGKISITTLGGTAPYNYTWSDGSQNQNISNIAVGKYKVTISDSRNCNFISPEYDLQKAENLTINALLSSPKCYLQASGKINLEVTGGSRPYSFKWSNGATSEDLNNIAANNYKVSITDANGCLVISENFALPQPNSLIFSTKITPPTCEGFNNGEISLLTTGGTAPYNFLWNIPKTSATITNLNEGNYHVTVSDANGCSIQSGDIILNAPQTMSLIAKQVRNETCAGKADGFILLSVSGGTTPYNYLWNKGQKTKDITTLLSDTYKITITDSKGCIFQPDSFLITGNQALTIKKDSLISPTCYNAADGKIFFEVKGGTTPYTYQWKDFGFNPNLFNLKSGKYQVTATDNKGCKLNTELTLNQPQNIDIQINTLDSISCYGDENACVDLAVTGGIAPYRYFWNQGQNTQDLCGVPAGDYKLTILDKNNCAFTSNAIIIPSPLPLKVVLKNNTGRCSGSAFGSLDIDVTGGSPPYNFTWSNGATSEDLNDVPSGTYSVVVTDRKSCKSVLSNIVIQNPLQRLRFESFTKKDISCNEAENGAVFAQIAGGQAPFAFNWSKGIENMLSVRRDSLLNLPKGNVYLVVTDNLGCVIKSDTLAIIEPNSLNINIKAIQNPTCLGIRNGAINLMVDGGTTPYQFNWSDGSKNRDATSLGAGNYKLTITDFNKCIAISPSFSLQNPSNSLSVMKDSVRNVSCKGKSDGEIYVKTNEGSTPYKYVWAHNQNLNKSHIVNLSAGFYSVTVTDSLGCKSSLNGIAVPEPLSIGVLIDSVKVSACKGWKEGKIVISPTGGTPPYQYLWSNGATTNAPSQLADNKYRVTVSDKNACKYISEEINIDSGDSLKATVSTLATEPGQNTGSATVSVSGGKSPYTYAWNDAKNQTSRTAFNLPKGNYRVTVTDTKGCTIVISSVEIKTTPLRETQLRGTINLFPNPSDGIAYLEYDLTESLQTFDIQVINILGETLLSQKNLDTQQGKINIDLQNAPTGVYLIRLIGDGKIGKTLRLVKE